MVSNITVDQALPAIARHSIEQLGRNLEVAIKRRRLKRSDVAQQAMISQPTLRAVLRGDPKTSIGAYAAVLAVVGLEGDLEGVASPRGDEVGLALAERELPKRVKARESRYDF